MATIEKPRDAAAKGRENGASASASRRRGGRRGRDQRLDEMLTAAALGGESRWLPGRAAIDVGVRLAMKPHRVAARGAGLVGELAKITVGRSEVEPPKNDRRFKD